MISNLHIITDSLRIIQNACEGGADWIQLRMKHVSDQDFLDAAKQAREITSTYGAKLIINDKVEIAHAVAADGVHLGKEDINPRQARAVLGDAAIVGGTANTQEDVSRIHEHVNYIGLGPYRFTSTKEVLSPILGADGIGRIARTAEKPVIAIGGILIEDLPELIQQGVHGIAISGALGTGDEVVENTKAFMEALASQNVYE